MSSLWRRYAFVILNSVPPFSPVIHQYRLSLPHPLKVPPSPLNTLRNPPVRAGSDLLHRHPSDGLFDGPLDGRADALDAALDGRLEERDVALPTRGPVGRLGGDTLGGSGHHHVEGSEGRCSGCAEEEEL